MVLPAGYFFPPMFDPAADPAINFGAIGAMFGHEFSHGFDDQGRKFDRDGRLASWWRTEDIAAYERRADVIRKQYDAFEALPGLYVRGDQTLGENIADLGGVLAAFDAYHASLGGAPAPFIDGFTGDQRFFMSWAQAWANHRTPNALTNYVQHG